jgi:hypothetical protein
MEELPIQKMLVQGLKVAILPLELICSVLVTHLEEILTTGKFVLYFFNEGHICSNASYAVMNLEDLIVGYVLKRVVSFYVFNCGFLHLLIYH